MFGSEWYKKEAKKPANTKTFVVVNGMTKQKAAHHYYSTRNTRQLANVFWRNNQKVESYVLLNLIVIM